MCITGLKQVVSLSLFCSFCSSFSLSRKCCSHRHYVHHHCCPGVRWAVLLQNTVSPEFKLISYQVHKHATVNVPKPDWGHFVGNNMTDYTTVNELKNIFFCLIVPLLSLTERKSLTLTQSFEGIVYRNHKNIFSHYLLLTSIHWLW